uniref:Uncharacterized protein n=1 Tax=Arundo donax TaxID=35708 RepID=A0A0A9TGU3_ARUDO
MVRITNSLVWTLDVVISHSSALFKK